MKAAIEMFCSDHKPCAHTRMVSFQPEDSEAPQRSQHSSLPDDFLNVSVPYEEHFSDDLLASRFVTCHLIHDTDHFVCCQLNHFHAITFVIFFSFSMPRLQKYKFFKLEQLITDLKHGPRTSKQRNMGKVIRL